MLAKDINAAPNQTKKYLVGLSFGPSSSSLIHILEESLQLQLKKRNTAAYDPIVVHVETGPSTPSPSAPESEASQLLAKFRERYPRFRYECVHLSSVLGLKTIDWSTLPALSANGEPAARLQDFFERLPSTTSRADILRIFIRHILISVALRSECDALLLGCSTTALAELTLGETAKGRGFSLPWQINDGLQSIRSYDTDTPDTPQETRQKLPIYYPLREMFRKELIIYTGLITPPLTDIIPKIGKKAGSVVSHKDISIEEVMSRYFEDVEENYPSIVANVVRTTAKLDRLGEGDAICRLCGMELDEHGDQRWKGEVGDDGGGNDGRLCYGCQRSMR